MSATSDSPGLYPPQIQVIKDWCNANVGEPALRVYVNSSRSAKLGETSHRNPNGLWALYKGQLYFKHSKDAIRIKLLGLVDTPQKPATMDYNVQPGYLPLNGGRLPNANLPRYNFNVRIVGLGGDQVPPNSKANAGK